MSLNKSKIDYLAMSEELIGRPGYTLNIVTGCKHGCDYCYAREMVEYGRLKGHPSYPYGFEPTFHPDRIKAIGGKPKLILLNDMGDVGGDWDLKNGYFRGAHTPEENNKVDWYEKIVDQLTIANEMVLFAEMNPQHILLLLTKRPEWYVLAEWPDNVKKGFTATTNKELWERWVQYDFVDWISLEPWLDPDPPNIIETEAWLVIGGLSGRNARSISTATHNWLMDKSIRAKRFTKQNISASLKIPHADVPREYPDSWKVQR